MLLAWAVLINHPSRRRGDVLSVVTTREVAVMPSPIKDFSAHPAAGSVIAEGRVLDAVARRDLAGTLDEIADALDMSYAELCAAIDQLTAIGWVSLELLADTLVLSLPEDARVAV